MQPSFWLERWQQGEIGFHQEEINSHLQQFWSRLGLAPESAVFVPLCGKSHDMLWLRAQGHRVLGVELSPLAVAAFFEENRLVPEVSQQGAFERWEADGLAILCGDFFDLGATDLEAVAGVYDRASLVALPPPLRGRYAEHLHAILPAAVPVLLVTMDYPQAEMDGPPFSVGEQEVGTLYSGAYQIEPLLSLDILAENPRFRERGLSRMEERVYRLDPV